MKELFANMGNESLSVINNPFNKDGIKSVSIRYERKFLGNGEWEATGWIEFQNGDTKGSQKFEAPTFDEVVLQMKACINQLLRK